MAAVSLEAGRSTITNCAPSISRVSTENVRSPLGNRTVVKLILPGQPQVSGHGWRPSRCAFKRIPVRDAGEQAHIRVSVRDIDPNQNRD